MSKNASVIANMWVSIFLPMLTILAIKPADASSLFISSLNNGEILEYNDDGTLLGVFGEANRTDSDLDGPNSLIIGPNGNLFVTSGGDSNILEFDGENGTFLGVFVDADQAGSGPGPFPFVPTGLDFDSNGNLFVSDGLRDQILEYDSNGNLLGVFATTGGDINNSLDGPEDLSFGPNGNLFTVTFEGILEYDPDGNFLGIFGQANPSDSSLFLDPSDFSFDSNGNLFVASRSRNILKYDSSGNFLGTVSGASGFAVGGLAFGPNGNLFATSFFGGQVFEFDVENDIPVGTFASGITTPTGLVFSESSDEPEPNPESVPEPGTVLSFLAMGGLGLASKFKKRTL
ncbi:hypothetical protein cce_4803 [Crocosphaera subtropica ATCC 51142]|uniref:Uncharacterized protein n=1 Tax=Crocosphaera subtropica (strain ATCC 51142 / BH68) TaxID=43989 RepID=B1X1Z0_CROS5|nr:NHL repeat-containing protein [Crocosphaera subtropica]ACB54151.1 hypothetical protein cce_4803 [Crocosphaera subtropica ATCC 51142]